MLFAHLSLATSLIKPLAVVIMGNAKHGTWLVSHANSGFITRIVIVPMFLYSHTWAEWAIASSVDHCQSADATIKAELFSLNRLDYAPKLNKKDFLIVVRAKQHHSGDSAGVLKKSNGTIWSLWVEETIDKDLFWIIGQNALIAFLWLFFKK